MTWIGATAVGSLAGIVLHAASNAPQPPVPHWLVLFAAVPAFWLAVGGAVLAIDRWLERFENRVER